jgi:hypothetical protein
VSQPPTVAPETKSGLFAGQKANLRIEDFDFSFISLPAINAYTALRERTSEKTRY